LRKFIGIIFLLIESVAFSQCKLSNTAYQEGEDVKYTVYYNWGFVWLDAGWVEFKVNTATYINRPVYHFDAFGSSYKSYDWLYKVRDHYQTYLDKETLLPLWHHRENYEGGFQVDNKYIFDWKNKRLFTYTQSSDDPFRKDTLKIQKCTFDLLSLIYYCRNLSFEGTKINDTIPLSSVIDNKIYPLYIRYLGKEIITDRKGINYNCIKFSVLLVEGTIFKGGEDMFVWISDDKNRVPILIEAKILVGSVKAFIESTNGLRYALDAKIINE